MLVGTSLVVIIPEGVETLYEAQGKGHDLHRRVKKIEVRAPTSYPSQEQSGYGHRRDLPTLKDIKALPGPVLSGEVAKNMKGVSTEPPRTPTTPGEIYALNTDDGAGSHTETHSSGRNPRVWIGVSLIFGFILMYLIDTIPSLAQPSQLQRNNIYSLTDLSSSSTPSAGSHAPSSATSQRSFSTTLGLIVHAMADGIALGASSTQPTLSFIIFFAIMIHKAPAAFGLTSVLLKQGLGKKQVRARLLLFSLAAPTGAISTRMILGLLGKTGGPDTEQESMQWWTGVVVLFSAGTFL